MGDHGLLEFNTPNIAINDAKRSARYAVRFAFRPETGMRIAFRGSLNWNMKKVHFCIEQTQIVEEILPLERVKRRGRVPSAKRRERAIAFEIAEERDE